MPSAPRLVILEDHPLVREALTAKAVSHLGDIDLVYQGRSVFDARAAIETHGADLVILDLDLADGRAPGMNVGLLAPMGSPILVVSALGAPATIREVFAAGARGFVSKSADPQEFVAAIDTSMRGDVYTSPEAAAALLADHRTTVGLSAQERRALVLYASGMKMRTVASTMGVSEGTAREYIKRVRAKYEKVGKPLRTKTDLYREVQGEGLLT